MPYGNWRNYSQRNWNNYNRWRRFDKRNYNTRRGNRYYRTNRYSGEILGNYNDSIAKDIGYTALGSLPFIARSVAKRRLPFLRRVLR